MKNQLHSLNNKYEKLNLNFFPHKEIKIIR